jgi:hypothetical protein
MPIPLPENASWRDRLFYHEYLPIALYLSMAGWAGIITEGRISPGSLDVLPGWLAGMWTYSIAFGGLIAPIGAFTGRTRIESAGLAMLAWGALLYGLVGAVLLWPDSVALVAVSGAIVSMCLIRMRKLGLSRRAQQVAASIARADYADEQTKDGE